MDREQIIHLLQTVQAYDSRNLDGPMVSAWSEAAKRGHWTCDKAEDAIHEHFATATGWIMPGHVTAIIKAKGRQPAPAAEVLAIAEPPASPERRAELMAQIRKLADTKGIR